MWSLFRLHAALCVHFLQLQEKCVSLQKPQVTIEILELDEPSHVTENEMRVFEPSMTALARASLRLSVGSMSLMYGASSVSFHDVSYEVKRCGCYKGQKYKLILNSVR